MTVDAIVESLLEASGRPYVLQMLSAEAKKAPSFEEFEKDFHTQIKHGVYWHWTDDPKFRVDLTKGPRDVSSASAGGTGVGELMVTSDLSAWSGYGNRPYVALIDMSRVPRKAYYQVKRGFGNEFIVTDPSRAKVRKVYSRSGAQSFDRSQSRLLSKTIYSQESLRDFYQKVTGK